MAISLLTEAVPVVNLAHQPVSTCLQLCWIGRIGYLQRKEVVLWHCVPHVRQKL
ncbi:hypothetical protein LDFHOB_00345 [Candidatus Electronema aureum]